MTDPIENYTDEELQNGFNQVMNTPELWTMINLTFERKDSVEANAGKVTYMRSFLSFGLPLNVNGIRYKSLIDRKKD